MLHGRRSSGSGLIVAATAFALLAAGCGGGSGTSATGTSGTPGGGTVTAATTKSVQLYLTDDFSTDYDAVWITVNKVAVANASGETTLVTYTPGLAVNLPTLKRTGAWLGTAQVPTDATSLRIYAASTARIQALDGTLKDVALSMPSGYIELRLEGWESSSGVLAADFDLPKFVLQGNSLVVATRLATSSDQAAWTQRQAEVEGTVTAVSPSSITVDSTRHGSVTLAIDANTTYSSRTSSTWTPAVGAKVEIYALYASSGAQGVARRISSEDSLALKDGNVELKGTITAIAGNKVTVTVLQSESTSVAGSVTFDISNARFERGSAATLQTAQVIEAYIRQQADFSWSATNIEIEGAEKSSSASGSGSTSTPAEIRGTVVSLSGTSLTLGVLYAENVAGVTVGTNYIADLASAYYERGSASCLTSGAAVELKGYLSNGSFKVVQVEISGSCGTNTSNTPPTVGSAYVEAKGTVTAVRAGEFDLTVFGLEGYSGTVPKTIIVQHDTGTIFSIVTAATLQAGNFIEVKGTLLGTTLRAVKIEKE